MKKTLAFKIVTGINEGYFHDNKITNSEYLLGKLWQDIALDCYNRTNIYVSAVITRSNTIYNTEWGCPIGGEHTYTITGVANPEYISNDNLDKWKAVVLAISKELKEKMKQSTMSIEFTKTKLVYLVNEKSNKEKIIEAIENEKFGINADSQEIDKAKELLNLLKQDVIDYIKLEQLGCCPSSYLDDILGLCSNSDYIPPHCIKCWKNVLK